MKKAIGIHPVVVCALLLIAGCVHRAQIQATSLVMNEKTMGVIGPVRGEDTQYYVFGIPTEGEGGDAMAYRAKVDALRPMKGDEILNPLVDDTSSTFLGIVTKRTVTVFGTGVKFKANGMNSDGTIRFVGDPKE